MTLDFEDAFQTSGPASLFLDATGSLARQWLACILTDTSKLISATHLSLLAGNYVTICDEPMTPPEIGLGLIASAIQLLLCLLMLNAGSGHRTDLLIVSGSANTPAMRHDANLKTLLPSSEGRGSGSKPAQQSTSPGSAPIGNSSTTPPSTSCAAIPVGLQNAQLKPELLLFHPSGSLPSYEVATIKPLNPDAAASMVKLLPGGSLSPLSMRRYLMDAFGAIYPSQIVGGPDWLNKDAYQVNGKIPDDLDSAFEKMGRDERTNENRMMGQCLLVDRFQLKAHFETRVLPVYELVPAKRGLKMTEVPAPLEPKAGNPPPIGDSLAPGSMTTSLSIAGLRILRGRAIRMQLLARVVSGDIGDRPIIDHTGFTGFFDIHDLTWAPLGDAVAASQSDAPSLTRALEQQLGIRVTQANDLIEVLVIDRIERPTPN